MNNRLIIIATSFFLLASFIFLSATEKRQSDIDTKNIWMIYFENPKDDSLNFTVENHSSEKNFHWQVLTDKSMTNQGDVTVELGEKKIIPVTSLDTTDKKIRIIVTSGENKKEIYKNIQ